MKNRSKTEIISQMLDAAQAGATSSKIMYLGFLSHSQLKKYLTLLLANGLIIHDSKTQRYKTTEKGMMVLKLYTHMGDLVISDQWVKQANQVDYNSNMQSKLDSSEKGRSRLKNT